MYYSIFMSTTIVITSYAQSHSIVETASGLRCGRLNPLRLWWVLEERLQVIRNLGGMSIKGSAASRARTRECPSAGPWPRKRAALPPPSARPSLLGGLRIGSLINSSDSRSTATAKGEAPQYAYSYIYIYIYIHTYVYIYKYTIYGLCPSWAGHASEIPEPAFAHGRFWAVRRGAERVTRSRRCTSGGTQFPAPAPVRPISLLRVSLLRFLDSNFRDIPYGHKNSTP